MDAIQHQLDAANVRLNIAIEEGLNTIIDAVKANGGLIKTPACSDKPTLYAYYEDLDELQYHEAIQGLRWDDELGLCICTKSMLDNYQYDTGYNFEYYYDFEGDDAEELEKVLADPSYFVEFEAYGLVRTPTIISILGGIQCYLQ